MKTYFLLGGSFGLLLVAVIAGYSYFHRATPDQAQFTVLEKKCGEPTPGTFPTSIRATSRTTLENEKKKQPPSIAGQTSLDYNSRDFAAWQSIEPKGFDDIFSSDDQAMQKAAIAMRDVIHDKMSFKECKKRFAEQRPPGVVSMDYEMILNVEIVDSNLSFRSASIENSTLSDHDFEDCIISELTKSKYDVDASFDSARYRFKYDFRFIFEIPSSDPNKPPLTGAALAKAAQEFREEWEKAKKQAEKEGIPVEDAFSKNVAIQRLPSTDPSRPPSD